MAKRFCLRGHDTEVLGRDSRASCKECKRYLMLDPEYRAHTNELTRIRRLRNPEFRSKELARGREYRKTNLEYRARERERCRNRRVSDKGIRYQLLSDSARLAARALSASQARLEQMIEHTNEVLAG